jgi:glycine cleavage system transcriptional repressor
VTELAVTAMGTDRPGIVAAVAGVLHDSGGNIEDSAMTILGGRFSMVLLVETELRVAELEQALRAGTTGFGLHLTVAEAGDAHASPAATHLLSVYGADRPGILAGVSRALAEAEANVTDLTTRVLGDETPVYAVVVELATNDERAVEAAVEAVASRLGVDWTLRALDDTTY